MFIFINLYKKLFLFVIIIIIIIIIIDLQYDICNIPTKLYA